MSRGLMLIIGGTLVLLALVVGGLIIYHPPRASYIDATPEPVGRPAAAAHVPVGAAVPTTVDATSAPVAAAPTAAINSALTFSGQAIIVEASEFPAEQQIAPAAPIIISFSAQSEAMQGLCAETAGVLDSGLCSIRNLTVDTVDAAGVHVPVTAQQFQTLGRVHDAGVALTIVRDNALLMASPAAQEPAAAVAATAAPAATAVTPAATAVSAATSVQQSQNRAAGTFVDGLPLIPIALIALLVVLCIAGGIFLLGRRATGTARARPAATMSQPIRARKGFGSRAPAVSAGLSLNLGTIEVQPLLDDDDAAIQSGPRAAVQSFETLPEDDLFGPASTVIHTAATAAVPVAGSAAGVFSPIDDRLFESDFALPPSVDAPRNREPDGFESGMHTFSTLSDDPFAIGLASPAQAAAPWPALADSDVFSTSGTSAENVGLLDDLPAEPIAAIAEPLIPCLGEPLPPAREPGALPPTAALDRPAALQWVTNKTE